MTDYRDRIFLSGNSVVFSKSLFSEEEILVARCLWFNFDPLANTITANLTVTFKRALYKFIAYAYQAFHSQPQYQVNRMELYGEIDAIYAKNFKETIEKHRTMLPWYDKMWAHQRQGVAAMCNRKVTFLSYSPRLGKTITTASLSIVSSVRRTLIITYDIGKWNWMRDMTDPKWGGEEVINKLNFTILDRTRKRSLEAFDEKFVIINYDSLANFLPQIMQGPPIGHIILSEAQKVKNFQGSKHKAVAKLIAQCPDARITFESGTPIMNRLNDLFAYFRLAGHPLGESYAEFCKMFLATERKARGKGKSSVKITGARNMPLLELCMSNFMIRKTQEECTDIPKHSYTNLYFDLNEWTAQYKEELERAVHTENRKVFESYIHSINRITALAKLPGIIEHTEALIDSEEKVVILTMYNDVAKRLKEHFGDVCTTVTGDDGKDKLDNAIRFMEDPNCMVCVVNMVAGGHTIDLSISSHVIVTSFPLSPKILEQALDRVKNLNKKRVSNVYYCICAAPEEGEVSVDEKLLLLNDNKDTDINAILDGKEGAAFQENAVDVLRNELMAMYSENKELLTNQNK